MGNVYLIGKGRFLKWWVSPTTMGFPTKNDHFGVFWGYHYFRKHPYGIWYMGDVPPIKISRGKWCFFFSLVWYLCGTFNRTSIGVGCGRNRDKSIARVTRFQNRPQMVDVTGVRRAHSSVKNTSW